MSTPHQRRKARPSDMAGGKFVSAGGAYARVGTAGTPTASAVDDEVVSASLPEGEYDVDQDPEYMTEATELTRVHQRSPPPSSRSRRASHDTVATAHAILHAPLQDQIELSHPYQDQQTHGHPTLPVVEAEGPTVREEMPNMVLLVILYTLQGVPLGLALGSIPFLLQQTVSYTSLGLFTFSTWPYSLKLLWSPFVDCWWWPRMGRRKSWIVPIQMIIGGMLFAMSYVVEEWIARGAIREMTLVCFILILFVATQDIAVDGWAISLLSKKNVGYASTCQSIGQNIGFFASYTIFLALHHADFCNRFRSTPSDVGFVTLGGYMAFWGVAYVICTAYLFAFKKEAAYVPEEDEDMGLRSIYGKMWRIMKLKPVRDLILILVTCRVAFAAGDNLTVLKLIEYGFPKENMAMMVVLLFPFELAAPIFIARWADRSGNPLHPWITGYPFRLVCTLLGVALVATFPQGELNYWFYARILVVQLLYSLASNVLFVSQCAFFAQVCDSSIGGTYMTLLNTLANLGSSWPKFFVFAAVDLFTCKAKAAEPAATTDAPAPDASPCFGGLIPLGTDGYYVISFICFIVGCGWYFAARRRVLQLGHTEKKFWSCS